MRLMLMVLVGVLTAGSATGNSAKRENPDGPNGTAWITFSGAADVNSERSFAAELGAIRVGSTKGHSADLALGIVLAPSFTVGGWVQIREGKTKDAAYFEGVGYLDQNYSVTSIGFSLKLFFNAPPPPLRETPHGRL